MQMKILLDKSNPASGVYAATKLVRIDGDVSVEWSNEMKAVWSSGSTSSGGSILRLLGLNQENAPPYKGLYRGTAVEKTEIDHWISFAESRLSRNEAVKKGLEYLDDMLLNCSYLVADRLTIADLAIFDKLSSRKEEALKYQNVKRYYHFIECIISDTVSSVDKDVFKCKLASAPTPSQLGAGDGAKKPARIDGGGSGQTAGSKKGGGGGDDKGKRKGEGSKKGEGGGDDKGKKKDEGKFVELPGAEMGKVIVRFPPEASGYLHIGHAKAALLNQYYQQIFQGQLIMRFDDTNPAKEKGHFEQVILEDLEMLQIKPDRFTYSSDYFDLILEYCEKLIKEGKAYADDTDGDTMRDERIKKIESKNRNNSVDKNLTMWEEMKRGSETGQKCCIRAKLDMNSANGCMRDPTIYRCKPEPHVRTGDKYKVYPTYDFTCPIVDSIEGVTHTLRTTEYHDRDEQYYWFIDALNLRRPHIYEYARLNLTNTVLSKRKLTWFVDEGHVEGWDDPRFPTVRGVLRRGMTVEGLKQFIVAQGSSRSVVTMSWDKIWAFNRQVIDPVAPRHTALMQDSLVEVQVKGASESSTQAPAHPKNTDMGTRNVWTSGKVFVEEDDAALFKEGENVTFINWGNLKIGKIHKTGDKVTKVEASLNLDDKNFKNTLKVTWLAATPKSPFTPIEAIFYDHIISKPVLNPDEDFKQHLGQNTKISVSMVGDEDLRRLRKGDIIQLQRKGFFVCDVEYKPRSIHTCKESPLVLFAVPDGKTKENPTVKIPGKQDTSGSVTTQGPQGTRSAAQVDADITAQGTKIRDLKAQKPSKDVIDAEVKKLLAFKAEFKIVTGKDWDPKGNNVPKTEETVKKTGDSPVSQGSRSLANIDSDITAQGNKIRDLKSQKSSKDVIDAEVKKLQGLKAEFKGAAGKDWDPKGNNITITKEEEVKPATMSQGEAEIKAQIEGQGNKVRQLKESKASKPDIDAAVKTLLDLKLQYKTTTGQDYAPPGGGNQRSGGGKKEKENKSKSKEVPAPAPKKEESGDGGAKKQTKLGIDCKKTENLADWFSQVITKGEMIEYYDVSGCYIFRPWSYSIWESIREWFDSEIRKLGVQNCYFPMFVSQAALQKEKDHIADFAPEVAWVTRSGDTELAEPIAIRPTSETVMYPSFAKWVQSHRDLPIKLNQWNNVVRWEFKHPQPFLRTREFLWQEGHTAFATYKEAEEEVYKILELYEKVYTDLLAIPVIPGRKTEKEKFPGGDYTTTVEAFVSASGRGLQGATSHHLGQNFSKMFHIEFEDPVTREKAHAYQNSWGLSTRTIGAMVMVHSDDQGLVLPPRVAAVQVVIVPCGITATSTDKARDSLLDECQSYEQRLCKIGVKAKGDYRDNYSPGWKYNHWELKGVPIRIEIGPRDMEKAQYVAVKRHNGEKVTGKKSNLEDEIKTMLDGIHAAMFSKAKEELDAHLVVTEDWQKFCTDLDKKNIIMAPFCGAIECEENIKKDSARDEPSEPGAPAMGAKSLCMPFKQPKPLAANAKCVHPKCNRKPQNYTLFGRSY